MREGLVKGLVEGTVGVMGLGCGRRKCKGDRGKGGKGGMETRKVCYTLVRLQLRD